MIFVDKRKLSRTSEVTESNGTSVTLEALHQLAASYFIDRESTLHKLHHIQIASTAIKVISACLSVLVITIAKIRLSQGFSCNNNIKKTC